MYLCSMLHLRLPSAEVGQTFSHVIFVKKTKKKRHSSNRYRIWDFSPMIHYVGSCHCKAITYEINLPDDHFRAPPTSEYDFCIDCRRVAGSLLVRPDQAPELMLEDRMALPPRNPIEMAERRRQIDHVQVFTQRRKTILFDLWLSIHVQESGEESKIGKRRKARYY